MEIEFEEEIEVECPKCKHKFTEVATGIIEVDLSDYASDHSWRD